MNLKTEFNFDWHLPNNFVPEGIRRWVIGNKKPPTFVEGWLVGELTLFNSVVYSV
jgi:hypothetical protein